MLFPISNNTLLIIFFFISFLLSYTIIPIIVEISNKKKLFASLIDEEMPVVVIATNKEYYEKLVSNIQEIKSRSGKIIAIVSKGDIQVKKLADHVIEIPLTLDYLTPLLSIVPLQLLSYHIAVFRNCNVDQPRNLAKSVTVE